MMASFVAIAKASKSCLWSWQLWLVQLVANLLLFALVAAWLLLPVENAGYLLLNILLACLLIVAALILHAGTLNYFYTQSRAGGARFKDSFERARQHVLALVLSAGMAYLLWMAVGTADEFRETFPAYLRSLAPMSFRRHAGLPAFQEFFEALLFALRWILLPGLVLPFLAGASRLGFSGFGVKGLTTWRKTVGSLRYWGALMISSLLGVLATKEIMGWRPDFRTSTFAGETASLAFRGLVSYLLGLFAWLLVSSVVGREGGAREDVGGQSAA